MEKTRVPPGLMYVILEVITPLTTTVVGIVVEVGAQHGLTQDRILTALPHTTPYGGTRQRANICKGSQ